MKQSVVEWLFEQMPKKLHPHYKKQLEQAKEMEEEQNNAKIQKAIELFEEAKRQADIAKDVIYLDGVLAVLEGIKNTKL